MANQTPRADQLPEPADQEGGEAAVVDLGALPTHIGYLLRIAQLAVFQDFIRSLAAVDIRPAQYSALAIIDRNPGIKQSDLGVALHVKRANMVPLVGELEARKLIRREQTAADRRTYSLSLTEKGKKLMRILYGIQEEHEQRAVQLIGEEGRETLIGLLNKLKTISALPDEEGI